MKTKWAKPLLTFLVITFLFSLIYVVLNRDVVKKGIIETKGEVLMVDNSELIMSGISNIGYQQALIRLTGQNFKGEELWVSNHMLGKKELDTLCAPKDRVVVALNVAEHKIIGGVLLEHDRLFSTLLLLYLFSLVLILYARSMGLRALFSFGASLFLIWQMLIPNLLKGVDPLWLTIGMLCLLNFIIIFSVSGWNKRSLIASVASSVGTLLTFVLTLIFGHLMKVSGFTAPYAEALIINGLTYLDIQKLFYAAVVIGASGASMDIAMDVSASLMEIKEKKPDITTGELMGSGFTIGRAVIGTMTTTLLLAYSGTFLTLLMLFMHKDTSIMRMLNLKIVSGEIMRTLIGSMGLVLVAPLTAILGAYGYCEWGQKKSQKAKASENA